MTQWAAIWMIEQAKQIRKKMDHAARHAVQMKENHREIVQNREGNALISVHFEKLFMP